MHRLLQLAPKQPRIHWLPETNELAFRTENLDFRNAGARSESIAIIAVQLRVPGFRPNLRYELDPAYAFDEEVCAVDGEGQVFGLLLAIRAACDGAGAAARHVPLESEGAGAGDGFFGGWCEDRGHGSGVGFVRFRVGAGCDGDGFVCGGGVRVEGGRYEWVHEEDEGIGFGRDADCTSEE